MNGVRFFRRWFRRAECAVCAAVVPNSGVRRHALWHANRAEFSDLAHGVVSGHRDVSVVDGRTVVDTGWVSDPLPPRSHPGGADMFMRPPPRPSEPLGPDWLKDFPR